MELTAISAAYLRHVLEEHALRLFPRDDTCIFKQQIKPLVFSNILFNTKP